MYTMAGEKRRERERKKAQSLLHNHLITGREGQGGWSDLLGSWRDDH